MAEKSPEDIGSDYSFHSSMEVLRCHPQRKESSRSCRCLQMTSAHAWMSLRMAVESLCARVLSLLVAADTFGAGVEEWKSAFYVCFVRLAVECDGTRTLHISVGAQCARERLRLLRAWVSSTPHTLPLFVWRRLLPLCGSACCRRERRHLCCPVNVSGSELCTWEWQHAPCT